MLDMVKNYKLPDGKTINEALLERFGRYRTEWVEKDNIVEFRVCVPGLSNPKVFRWAIERNGFYAINGPSITLTPELDKLLLESERRMRRVPDHKRAIYYFMKSRFEKADEQGGYIPEHDIMVLEETSRTFGITIEEAERTYDEVEKLLFGLE